MEIIEINSPQAKELLELLDRIAACAEYAVKNHVPHLGGERYLNGREVCGLLKITSRSLQEYRNKGLIAYYKLEGKFLYRQSEIEKMLRDNYVPPL